MRKEQIVVGKAYLNSDATIMREVIEEIDENCVVVNAFDLCTGMLVPTRHRVHHRGQLARWADREATDAEKASVHPYEPDSWYHALPWSGRPGMSPSEPKTPGTEPEHLMFPPGK